jgi:hypothetical protein
LSTVSSLKHEFVEFIPDQLQAGIIYVSIKYATAVHQCCCGCGNEVVTPIAPTGWQLTFDGKSVSLNPSIGNWSYPCKSHYWIIRNRVQWAEAWSKGRIQAGRTRDELARDRYYNTEKTAKPAEPLLAEPGNSKKTATLWSKIKGMWS